MHQAIERRRLHVISEEALRRPADGTLCGIHLDRLEDKLDDALEETFPGSDPVSVKVTK